jgi:hypothetical protein
MASGARTFTEAMVTVHWEVQGGMVRFTPRFSFPLPGQVGLAYNFYQFVWTGPASDGHTTLVRDDLTHGCQSPGVGLFPNQIWDAGEYSFSAPFVPGAMVVFLVWGQLG